MIDFKKLGLSAAVVLTFVAYSYQQRHEVNQIVVGKSIASKPSGNSSSPDSSSTSVPIDTTTPGSSATINTVPTSRYKDGSYTGSVADAYYGNIQVRVVISGGQISDVQFLDHPSDNPTSNYINSQAMPMLKQEAITAQSANVDGVSGATDTSIAFRQSLQNALSQALR